MAQRQSASSLGGLSRSYVSHRLSPASARCCVLNDLALSRPRDIFEVRLLPEFHALHREIWDVLKDEVMKGYAQSQAVG